MRIGHTVVILLAAVALLASACSSDGGSPIFGDEGTGVPDDQQDDSPFDGSGEDDSGGGFDSDDDPVGETTDPYRPLPLREGLGTFDSYQWHMELSTVGPSAEETSEVVTDWSHNADPAASRTRTVTTETGPDFDGEPTVQEVYVVEGETCQYDGAEWVYTEATDQQQEVLDVVERLFDVTIVPDNPVEVGSEPVSGIPATHWSYTVSGFGAESGALVTANQVDYWVADDTGVLLKYTMEIESRSGPSDDPEAEVYRAEASAELTSANQAVPISLPADCLAARDEQDAEE